MMDLHMEDDDFGGEKSENLIRSGEEALGIPFPPTYKSFIKKYGWGGIKGDEWYGIMDLNFHEYSGPDCVRQTLSERKDWGLPHQFIVIGETGYGPSYVLDSSKPNAHGEYPVILYDSNGYYEKIHEDFGDFLLEEVTLSLQDNKELEKEERSSSDRSFFSRT